tara:strand:- start:57 stop:683 length:627 start_codon:yes stop_codon:yes gene_type:complete
MFREGFPNVGIMKRKLDKEAINKLKIYIKNKKGNYKPKLAGNINKSYNLKDKDNWFFNNVLLKFLNEYDKDDLKAAVPATLTNNCKYVLNSFWVNFQKKYEFNPLHLHGAAVFSFVVWMKIPSSYKKEKEISFIKESNSPCPNTFEFVYTNILGSVRSHRYHLEPEDEGTILLFPATLLHQVYPFYLSNKHRISISGNIALDPKQIIQ